MKTINYGYLITIILSFLISDMVIFTGYGFTMFSFYLLLFQLLVVYAILFFYFKIVEYSTDGILIKMPFRGYKKTIDKRNIRCFLFRYDDNAGHADIDLYVQLKSAEDNSSSRSSEKKEVIKQYVSRKDVLILSDWFKENGYDVNFRGDFDMIDFKKSRKPGLQTIIFLVLVVLLILYKICS